MHDVVIIGGGIIGCCVAFELADRHGVRVTVLERSIPGAEASSAAAGILGAQIECHGPTDPARFDLMLASRSRHAALDARLSGLVGFGSGYRPCGAMKVTARPDTDLRAQYAWQAEHGAAVSFLDGDAVRRYEPALAPDLCAGVFFPDEAQVDPPALLRALQQACAARGVVFRGGVIVRGIARAGGTSTGRVLGVTLQDGVLDAGAVVVAAGSWSSLIEGLPAELRRVRPVRGQIVQVETRPPIVKRVVFGDRGYVLARPDGRTILGSTMEEAGHVKEVTAGGLYAVLGMGLGLVPGLGGAAVTATWAGFRPAAADDRPMLGAVEPGLFVATGHHRNGVLLGPETGRLVADLVATGRCDRDLGPFAPRG